MKTMLEELLKLPINSASFFSFLIVLNLLRMGLSNMTFLNKMFLIYFSIETITSLVDGYLLFRLRENR